MLYAIMSLDLIISLSGRIAFRLTTVFVGMTLRLVVADLSPRS